MSGVLLGLGLAGGIAALIFAAFCLTRLLLDVLSDWLLVRFFLTGGRSAAGDTFLLWVMVAGALGIGLWVTL